MSTWMYPDGPVIMPPGIQPREDWVTMLSNMMDVGISQSVVFEEHAAETLVLDSWLEILQGVQKHYRSRIFPLQQIAPHQRNRHFRHNRRLWRH